MPNGHIHSCEVCQFEEGHSFECPKYKPVPPPGLKMGISQWKLYGEKYGYWGYFRQIIAREIDEMITRRMRVIPDEPISERIDGFTELSDIRKKINKLLV